MERADWDPYYRRLTDQYVERELPAKAKHFKKDGKKVLLVEDHEGGHYLFSKIFEAGFPVQAALWGVLIRLDLMEDT